VWSSLPAWALAIGANAVAEWPAAPANRTVWPVAALVLAAGDALAARFGAVAVRGELSGLTKASSGHVYFSLKDSDGAAALLRCAMFRRAASMLAFTPSNGQQVELRGRLGVYEARGELQLIVEGMSRVGEGSLYEEFVRKRALLAAQGLFDVAIKRPISAAPVALGVVTSLGAAALHDVISALKRRAPHVRVVVYPSAVQGAEAPASLVRALQVAGARDEVDTVLLVRGGGSLEDLAAFNDEALVRAIRACPLPVVCGVGHESDVTLADLAADLRAATPTAAAELAAPDANQHLDTLALLARRAGRAVGRRLETQAMLLDRASLRLAAPARMVQPLAQRLNTLALRAQRAMEIALVQRQTKAERVAVALPRAHRLALQGRVQRLAQAQVRLQALDPSRVLTRGYVWLTDANGSALTTVAALGAGMDVQATLSDGQAGLKVTTVSHKR
jgi:exodeoxyribonuclease VII large subunit